MTRAYLYARYSSDLQDARSLDDQLRDLRAYAARKDWQVVDVFTDAAISGATMLRPGLQALLAGAAAGSCDVVLAEALDRISRDLGDTAQIFKRLTYDQARLHTIAEGDVAQMHVAIKGLLNNEFLVALSAKVKRGMRGNIERGLSAGGVSYGYEVVRELDDRGELKRGLRRIVPAEAAVVRRIFDEYVAGVSPREICRQLNAEKIAAPRARLWAPSAIIGHKARGSGILHNDLYIGQLLFNRVRKTKDPTTGRSSTRANPPAEWQRQAVPHLRIIADEIWNAAQGRMRLNASAQASAANMKKRPAYFLAGLVRCGSCGAAYKARDARQLVCTTFREHAACDNNRRVVKADLEASILAEIQALLSRPAAISAAVRRYHDARQKGEADRQQRRRALIKEQGDLRGKIDRLVAAIAEGSAGRAPAAVLRQIDELEEREKTVAAELARDPAPTVTLHPNAGAVYAAKVAGLAAAIGPAAAPAVKARAAELLRALIDRIDIIPTPQRHKLPGYRWELSGRLAPFLGLAAGENPAKAPEQVENIGGFSAEQHLRCPAPLFISTP